MNGDYEPTKGVRQAHRNLVIGYFSQHHVDGLDMDVSSVELLARRFPGEFTRVYFMHSAQKNMEHKVLMFNLMFLDISAN